MSVLTSTWLSLYNSVVALMAVLSLELTFPMEVPDVAVVVLLVVVEPLDSAECTLLVDPDDPVLLLEVTYSEDSKLS